MLVAREREARIDHEHLSPGLVHGHVLADLTEAAERDDPKGVGHSSESMRVRRPARPTRDLGCGRLEEPESLEAAADCFALLGRRLDERQTQAADLVPEEVQRALDRNRVDDDPEELDRRPELLVQRTRALDVAGTEALYELFHLRPHDMRVHANSAATADAEEGEDQVVVAGEEVEPELDDPPA